LHLSITSGWLVPVTMSGPSQPALAISGQRPSH